VAREADSSLWTNDAREFSMQLVEQLTENVRAKIFRQAVATLGVIIMSVPYTLSLRPLLVSTVLPEYDS